MKTIVTAAFALSLVVSAFAAQHQMHHAGKQMSCCAMACCGAPGKPKPASKFWSSRIGHDSRFASMSACCGGGCCAK
jgi:hypothetical protein